MSFKHSVLGKCLFPGKMPIINNSIRRKNVTEFKDLYFKKAYQVYHAGYNISESIHEPFTLYHIDHVYVYMNIYCMYDTLYYSNTNNKYFHSGLEALYCNKINFIIFITYTIERIEYIYSNLNV